MVSTLYLSPRNIQDLGKSIAKAIGPSKSGMTSGSTDTSKTGGVDTAAILNSIRAKYEVKVEKQQAKTDKLADKRSAISDLKLTSSNLSSAISNLKTTGGSSIFNSLEATGVLPGVTITPSSVAKAGSHTMSVSSVASKQTIVIQSKDGAGNPAGFAAGAADVTGADGFFTRGSTFKIYTNSNNNGAELATITIDNAATTLQEVADKINASAANATLTAAVRTDSTGDKLVLESINAGTAGSFYIDDRDITGKIHLPAMESEGQAAARVAYEAPGSSPASVVTAVNTISPGSQAHAAAAAAALPGATALSVVTAVDTAINLLMPHPSAISTLSISPSYKDVKSLDIYSRYGNAFTSRDVSNSATREDFTSFQGGEWNIGVGFIKFDASDLETLDTIVSKINAGQQITGVTAKVVEVPGGDFVIRVTASHGTPLNYTPDSTMHIFPEGIATATRIRPTTGSDTNITVDGVHYNAGSALTINAPNANIASITVSSPTPLDTFSITQDVTQLTTSIAILVDSINEAQQFIYQQREEDAPLRSNNLLSQLSNMINSVTSSNTDAMSLSRMGITWTEYTPTSAERKEGVVPARYLSINPTTLNNILTSNFDAVKGFFAGSLAHAAGDATASIAALTSPLSISQFDLKVSYDSTGFPPTFTVKANGGAGLEDMNALSLGGTKLLITGIAGTIFEGLSINYNYTGAGGLVGLETLGAGGYTLPAIKVYNGASLKLSRPLASYLDVYGPLEKAITAEANKIKTSNKQIQRIIDQKNAALAKAQEKIDRIRFNTAIAESLKESFKNKN